MIDDSELADALRNHDLLDRGGLRRAMALSQTQNRTLYATLIANEIVDEARLVEIVSEMMNVESVDLTSVAPQKEALERVPRSLAVRNRVLPLALEQDRGIERLVLAMSDPLDMVAMDEIADHTGIDIRPLLAGPGILTKTLERVYPEPNDESDIELDAMIASFVAEPSEMSEISEVDSPDVTVEGDPELIQEAANSSFLADESSATTALGRIAVEKIPAPGTNLEDTSTGPQDEQHTEFSGKPSQSSKSKSTPNPQTGDELDALLDRIRRDRDRPNQKRDEPEEAEEAEEAEDDEPSEGDEVSTDLARRILDAEEESPPEVRKRLAEASRREILESAVVALVKADVVSARDLVAALDD